MSPLPAPTRIRTGRSTSPCHPVLLVDRHSLVGLARHRPTRRLDRVGNHAPTAWFHEHRPLSLPSFPPSVAAGQTHISHPVTRPPPPAGPARSWQRPLGTGRTCPSDPGGGVTSRLVRDRPRHHVVAGSARPAASPGLARLDAGGADCRLRRRLPGRRLAQGLSRPRLASPSLPTPHPGALSSPPVSHRHEGDASPPLIHHRFTSGKLTP